jgi:hypothetical protein
MLALGGQNSPWFLISLWPCQATGRPKCPIPQAYLPGSSLRMCHMGWLRVESLAWPEPSATDLSVSRSWLIRHSWGLSGACGAADHWCYHAAAHPDWLPATVLWAQSAGPIPGAAWPVPSEDWDREVCWRAGEGSLAQGGSICQARGAGRCTPSGASPAAEPVELFKQLSFNRNTWLPCCGIGRAAIKSLMWAIARAIQKWHLGSWVFTDIPEATSWAVICNTHPQPPALARRKQQYLRLDIEQLLTSEGIDSNKLMPRHPDLQHPQTIEQGRDPLFPIYLPLKVSHAAMTCWYTAVLDPAEA